MTQKLVAHIKTKFKVGDRVRWIEKDPTYRAKYGAEAIVKTISDEYLGVEWDQNDPRWYNQFDGEYFFHRFELINSNPTKLQTTLPTNSQARKDYPIYEGVLKYFPAATALVAYISKIGNDKHNPGQPMHHARSKSGDHADCIIRHMIDMGEDMGHGVGRDENGVPQVGYIAWRALALCQEWLEKNEGKPMAPGARE